MFTVHSPWLYFATGWGSALNSALLGYFKSLKGVYLTMPSFEIDTLMLDNTDVMRGAAWKALKLPEVIRAFQQHQLESSLTSFRFEDVTQYSDDPTMPAKASVVEDVVKAKLLEHHPRRTSKRA